MRLDFNVLWVEDQPSVIKSQLRAIDRKMAEEGFQLNASICTHPDQVNEYLSDSVFKDEIDLIMVDWDLGQDVKGEDVITDIREKIFYKDIIFYSAVNDLQNLKEASFKEGHEGLYYVRRVDLVEEVEELFHSMIKKVLDLDHTRGIVMGATSDVDETARECLALAHNMLDEAGQTGMLGEMIDLLDRKIPNLQTNIDRLKGSADIHTILAAHSTFTANDRLRVLVRILNEISIEGGASHVENIKFYINTVVPQRNRLGHQVLSPEGRPVGLATTDGKTISLQELRSLRKKLLDARQRFRDLHGTLSGTSNDS